MYGYYMGTDAQTRAGGSLLGKVVIAGNPLTWDPTPVNIYLRGEGCVYHLRRRQRSFSHQCRECKRRAEFGEGCETANGDPL